MGSLGPLGPPLYELRQNNSKKLNKSFNYSLEFKGCENAVNHLPGARRVVFVERGVDKRKSELHNETSLAQATTSHQILSIISVTRDAK